MGYIALYRAYRPQYFRDVVGQKHVVKTLQNALKLKKIAHAYLFSGPRGTGKTSIAKILAKALNCQNGTSDEPCGVCDTCKGITLGNIQDVIEIDAASNNGVDEIREIRDKVNFLPSTGRYKVYIIDEVHMLSNGAFNALLKTLEEPPSHVVFILATTEPHKIPATILSRCQRFDFQGISSNDIYVRLKEVINSEKIKSSNEALIQISEACEGGMRDALSLLDQAISYSTSDNLELSDVLAVSGNVSNELLIVLLNSCLDNNQENILNIIGNLIDDGKEIPKITADIIGFLRDILIYKAGLEGHAIFSNSDFVKLSTKLDSHLIYEWLNSLNEVQNNIKFTNQKRAYLELGLLKMSDKRLNDYNSLINRVQVLENELNNLKNNHLITNNTKKSNEIDNEMDYFSSNITEPQIKSIEKIYEDVIIDNSFITSSEIQNVLSKASKDYKEKVQNAIDDERNNNPNNTIYNIIDNGKVTACSSTTAILTLNDEARCNRLMKRDNHSKLLSIINKREQLIKDIICIPLNIWDILVKEYMIQYKENKDCVPVLPDIKIMVKRDNSVKNNDDNEKIINQAYDLFGKDIVKIEEK